MTCKKFLLSKKAETNNFSYLKKKIVFYYFWRAKRRRWQVMDKERSLLLPCLFYFIISWSLVAAGGKGKNEGRVVHAAGGLSELGGGAPPCRLSYPSYVSLTTSPGLGNT